MLRRATASGGAESASHPPVLNLGRRSRQSQAEALHLTLIPLLPPLTRIHLPLCSDGDNISRTHERVRPGTRRCFPLIAMSSSSCFSTSFCVRLDGTVPRRGSAHQSDRRFAAAVYDDLPEQASRQGRARADAQQGTRFRPPQYAPDTEPCPGRPAAKEARRRDQGPKIVRATTGCPHACA